MSWDELSRFPVFTFPARSADYGKTAFLCGSALGSAGDRPQTGNNKNGIIKKMRSGAWQGKPRLLPGFWGSRAHPRAGAPQNLLGIPGCDPKLRSRELAGKGPGSRGGPPKNPPGTFPRGGSAALGSRTGCGNGNSPAREFRDHGHGQIHPRLPPNPGILGRGSEGAAVTSG